MFLLGSLQEHPKTTFFPLKFPFFFLSFDFYQRPSKTTTLHLPFYGHYLVLSQLKLRTVLPATFFCLEKGGGSFLRNVRGYLPHYMASHP